MLPAVDMAAAGELDTAGPLLGRKAHQTVKRRRGKGLLSLQIVLYSGTCRYSSRGVSRHSRDCGALFVGSSSLV